MTCVIKHAYTRHKNSTDSFQMPATSSAKKALIFISKKNARSQLFFDNTGNLIDNFSKIALQSVKFAFNNRFTRSVDTPLPYNFNIIISTEALNIDNIDGCLRNFVLSPSTVSDYQEIFFDTLYFKTVSKTYPTLIFDCSNKDIYIEHITLLCSEQ